MQTELQISYRGVEKSEALEQRVRQKVAKLERLFSPIIWCEVVIEQLHRQHQTGNYFQVIITIGIPGNDIAVSRFPGQNHAYEDVYVALNNAFNKAARQLQDRQRTVRRDTKSRQVPAHGIIKSIYSREGFGYLEASDGHEVYFHKNSVMNLDIRQLHVGDKVRYSEEIGEKGPQASSLFILGKYHYTSAER